MRSQAHLDMEGSVYMAVAVYDRSSGCQPPHKTREEAPTATYSRDGPMCPRQPRYPYAVTPYAPISRAMNLDLTDDEKGALIKELDQIIREDRYPLSPRILMMKAILGKLRPEPERPPLPPIKYYEPPKAVTRKRRRG